MSDDQRSSGPGNRYNHRRSFCAHLSGVHRSFRNLSLLIGQLKLDNTFLLMFCLIHRRIASACPPVLAAHRNTTPAFLDHHSSWLHGSLHWPARSSAKSQCPCLGADCWCRLLFTVAVSSQRITISNRNRGEIKSVSLKSLENNGIQFFAPFEPFKYLTRFTHCAVQGHVYTTCCTLRCTQLVIIEQRRCWSILMPESSFCLVLVLNTASLPRSGSTIFSIQIKFRLIIMSPADYCSCQCTLSTINTIYS